MNIYHNIDQIDFVFDKGEQAYQEFVDKLSIHIKDFSPELCATLSDQQLHEVINLQLQRGRQYNLKYEENYTLYVEISFSLGSFFDVDPQYLSFSQILVNRELNADEKTQQLYDVFIAYLDKVVGDDSQYVRQAVLKLEQILDKPAEVKKFTGNMLNFIQDYFPQKYNYVGGESYKKFLSQIIERGKKEYEIKNDYDMACFVIVILCFGFRADIDPVYPWIGKSLRYNYPQNIRSVEEKSKTWLKAVVNKIQQGVYDG